MKKAACYLRVSTDDQVEYSPDAQLRSIREFCKRNDYDLQESHIYIDEGISGRSAAKRPAFQKMIGAAKLKDKPFEAIVVHKFDRFARSREDSVVYKSLLRRECGVRVVSVTENIEDDKFSVILEAMLEAMAEYYSINLAEEVKKGMTEKALRGEPLSIAPYGYKMEEKQLVIYPEQAEIIRKIFNDFLNGLGYIQIARQLNAMGLRSNRGSKFENRTVEYILRNPVYIGKIRWNPTGRTRRDYDNENVLIAQGNHEPIISEETFAKAQDRVMDIKSQNKRNSKSESASHWLVGIVKCSNCGKGLVKNGKHYFQCRGYVAGTCNLSHLLPIKEAEDLVLAQMEYDSASSEPLNIHKKGKAVSAGSYVQKQITGLERRIERLKEAYIAGVGTLEEYKTGREKIEVEIEKLKVAQEVAACETSREINRVGLSSIAEKLRLNLPTLDKKVIAKSVLHHILYNKPEKTLYVVYSHG